MAKYEFSEGELDPPASPEIVDGISSNSEIDFPEDYLNFLRHHNGGEGFIGDNYVVLWKAEELCDFNQKYEVEKYAPGIFLFGSDGGGEGYGFDTESMTMPIVQIPFIGMERRYAVSIADNFSDFFSKLAESQ